MKAPRRRFKIEVVGFGDTFLDAMQAVESALEEAYADPPKSSERISGVGWICIDEDSSAPTGEEYMEAVREFRRQRAGNNGKDKP